MKFEPYDYQEKMLNHAEVNTSFAYFVSCGMGKTVTTLKILEDRILTGQTRGALIVAPVRVCSITWPTQVEQWDHSSWMRVAHLRTKEGLKAWHDGTADVYLVNPEQLPKLVPLMFKGKKNLPVDTVIFDELSLAKNPNSKRFNALRPYLGRFKARIGLTGTPCPNNYLDLFAQVRLLDDGQRLGRSFSQFRQTYFTADYMGFKFTINPGAKEAIDAKLADLCLVMLGDDYLDVPICETVDVPVSLPPEAKAAYKVLEKELLLELEKSDVVALSAAALSNKLLQVTGGTVYGEEHIVNTLHSAKIDAIKALRKKHKNEPILILTAYKHEMQRILSEIEGSKVFDERDLADWQAGKIKTWVANPRSLSHGIDGLQKGGRIAIWSTLTWSNETYIQCNARLVRTGQSSETIIYRVIATDTIDDAVCEALRVKMDTQSGLMNALKALQKMKK